MSAQAPAQSPCASIKVAGTSTHLDRQDSVFLNYMSRYFQAAEPKKTSSTSPAATEAAQAVKAKEEPKPAAKSSEAVVDNKPVSAASQAGEEAVNLPKKLEKRNSIQLFFKNLVRGS